MTRLPKELLTEIQSHWSFDFSCIPPRGRLPVGSRTITDYLEKLHPEDKKPFADAVNSLTPEASSFHLAYRLIDDNGRTVPLQAHAQGRFRNGVVTGVTGVYTGLADVFDLARDGSKLPEEVQQFFEAIPDMVWNADSTGRTQYANLPWQEYSGKSPSSPAEWHELVHPDDRQTSCEKWFDSLKTGKPYTMECRLLGGDTLYRWFLIKATAIRERSGQISCWIGVCSDVQRRKRVELSLQTAASEQTMQVTQALAEKTVLLKEIHHRVKNNLAVVSSLLGIAANNVVSPDMNNALKSSQHRLLSIALVHEQLYNSNHLDFINFADYATELAHSLYATIAPDHNRVRLDLDVEPVTLGIHRAVPCGLILNELVTNAFKYAFPDDRRGSVKVVFRAETSGNIFFLVSDDGVGMNKTEFNRKATTGLRVVEVLTKQLDGKFCITSTKGTTCEVRFPQGTGRMDPSLAVTGRQRDV